MSIGPAKTERAHSRQGRARLDRPCTERGLHPQWEPIERNVRIGLAKVQVWRDLPMPERERHFDQAGDAGRRLEVADIGLD